MANSLGPSDDDISISHFDIQCFNIPADDESSCDSSPPESWDSGYPLSD